MAEEIRLMKGNEAIGEAAVRAGCRAYFGYPITPQNELTAYMAKHMLAKGRIFIQAESEIAAINMVYGASSTGARAMTSSSSPGVSLKQEGISYLCGADLPAVIVNVARAGPGLGAIAPGQGDYFQRPAAADTATTIRSSSHRRGYRKLPTSPTRRFRSPKSGACPCLCLRTGSSAR